MYAARMSKTIAVAVNVYNEPKAQIEACLGRIFAHLSEASVAVFCNGVLRDDIYALIDRYQYTLIGGENLATNSTWNLWWRRMLKVLYDTGAATCFKFDPDTMVDMTPRNIPIADYFGTVWSSKRYGTPFIQGGVTGLSRRAVEVLLSSGVLDTPNSASVPLSQHDWDCFADDQHLAMALSTFEIFPSQWDECKSAWRTPVLNEPAKYAIVHPRYYSATVQFPEQC
jgi:hypothetical protein